MVDVSVPLEAARRLNDCIANAVAEGELDRARGTALQAELRDLEARYSSVMPEAAARDLAARHLREAASRKAPARFHSVQAQLQAIVRIRDVIEAADNPDLVLRDLIEHSPNSGSQHESVQSLGRAYIRSVNAGISDALRRLHTTMTGRTRDAELLGRVLDELHGDATGDDVARALAEIIEGQKERLRQVFNAHGGNIARLENHGITHTHDPVRLRRAGYEAWREGIEGRLDWSRIEDFGTGEPFVSTKGERPSPDIADRFLREVYEGITTQGWSRRDPSMGPTGRALYNRRADHRVLHFQTGRDWLEYNKEFGQADPWSSLIGGLHGMARDIAQMRVLGPNPRMGLDFAAQVARKRASEIGDEKLINRVDVWSRRAATMLSHFDGTASIPENIAWGAFFGGARDTLVATQLGSAVLSATTDIVTVSVAARTAGLAPGNVLARHVELMSSPTARDMAASGGYIADTLADAGAGAARYYGEQWSSETAHRLAGFTIRASGLSFWTDMLRLSLQMEFAAELGRNAGRGFNDLPEALRATLSERGITHQQWDHLRGDGEAIWRPREGAEFLSPFHWLEHQTTLPRMEAEGLSMRLQALIEERMEEGIPTQRLEGRTRLVGDTRPGSVPGEIARSFGSYRGYSMSLMLSSYRRYLATTGRWNRIKFASSLSVGLILMGAVAIQLKEIARGRDPRPINDEKFWMAAVFQGGGLGIFGDFFAAETSRAGGGFAETIGGPVAGLIGDLIRPVASNAARLANGQDMLLGRDFANLVRNYTPVASSLWQVRQAYSAIVADGLQSFLDPEAEAQWRRDANRRARDYGNSDYWERGAILPGRGPDLTNMWGQR